MRPKSGIFLSVAMLFLVLSILVNGCSSQSDTSQSVSTSTVTPSLSPNGVAMVNGKEITKADLAGAMNDLQMQVAAGQLSSDMPKLGTPEYSDLERQVVERLADEEIEWFEAERMGFSVSETEINIQIDQYKQQDGGEPAFNQKLKDTNTTLDRLKDQTRKSLLFDKLFIEVTKNVAAGANESETEKNKQAFFDKWVQEAISKYVIIYADQYKPTAPTTKTS